MCLQFLSLRSSMRILGFTSGIVGDLARPRSILYPIGIYEEDGLG
jgi:hypothetical protein